MYGTAQLQGNACMCPRCALHVFQTCPALHVFQTCPALHLAKGAWQSCKSCCSFIIRFCTSCISYMFCQTHLHTFQMQTDCSMKVCWLQVYICLIRVIRYASHYEGEGDHYYDTSPRQSIATLYPSAQDYMSVQEHIQIINHRYNKSYWD